MPNLLPPPRRDWAGLSVFALATASGIAVVIVVVSEFLLVLHGEEGTDVLATAISAVLGAMIGAVSTYAGMNRRPRDDDRETTDDDR